MTTTWWEVIGNAKRWATNASRIADYYVSRNGITTRMSSSSRRGAAVDDSGRRRSSRSHMHQQRHVAASSKATVKRASTAYGTSTTNTGISTTAGVRKVRDLTFMEMFMEALPINISFPNRRKMEKDNEEEEEDDSEDEYDNTAVEVAPDWGVATSEEREELDAELGESITESKSALPMPTSVRTIAPTRTATLLTTPPPTQTTTSTSTDTLLDRYRTMFAKSQLISHFRRQAYEPFRYGDIMMSPNRLWILIQSEEGALVIYDTMHGHPWAWTTPTVNTAVYTYKTTVPVEAGSLRPPGGDVPLDSDNKGAEKSSKPTLDNFLVTYKMNPDAKSPPSRARPCDKTEEQTENEEDATATDADLHPESYTVLNAVGRLGTFHHGMIVWTSPPPPPASWVDASLPSPSTFTTSSSRASTATEDHSRTCDIYDARVTELGTHHEAHRSTRGTSETESEQPKCQWQMTLTNRGDLVANYRDAHRVYVQHILVSPHTRAAVV